MATLKILLRTTHKKKDNTYPIIFRITAGRNTKIISSGYAVKENQFKDGIVIKHTDAVLYNNAIESKRAKLMAEIINADITGATITKDITLNAAIDKLLQHYEVKNMAASFNRMLTNKRIIKEIGDTQLKQLNKEYVDKYIENRYTAGNGVNTVRKNLQDMATILHFVDHIGKNYFSAAMKLLTPLPVNREKLTIEEIKLIENAKVDGLTDIARDMFLFSYYTHGMRFESVITFHPRMINNGHINYRMNKGKKMREIEVHPKLQAIINKYTPGLYLFPLIVKEHDAWNKKEILSPKNVQINTHLKRLAVICGIDKKFSMHCARNSFASNAYELGVSSDILKESLGHSSLMTTNRYLKSLSYKSVNDAVGILWKDK